MDFEALFSGFSLLLPKDVYLLKVCLFLSR